ncbi:hypothetical protein DL96DRAFT_1579052 [Flagelloscypha sp. PMI_526]|nr:hypothetical protein DL96DRAFT_1579052 [Flagelloscypha sp. PMI_526]
MNFRNRFGVLRLVFFSIPSFTCLSTALLWSNHLFSPCLSPLFSSHSLFRSSVTLATLFQIWLGWDCVGRTSYYFPNSSISSSLLSPRLFTLSKFWEVHFALFTAVCLT